MKVVRASCWTQGGQPSLQDASEYVEEQIPEEILGFVGKRQCALPWEERIQSELVSQQVSIQACSSAGSIYPIKGNGPSCRSSAAGSPRPSLCFTALPYAEADL